MESFDDRFSDISSDYQVGVPTTSFRLSQSNRSRESDGSGDINIVGRALIKRTCKIEQKCRAKVQHDYSDYARIAPESIFLDKPRTGRGGVVSPFPEKLYEMLEIANELGFSDTVAWCPHGRAFIVHKPKQFASNTMRTYFKHTKFTSFQRQLNLYGFRRITKGRDSGAYYHEFFLRGRPDLCKYMLRQKVKGTWCKAANNPDAEPNFYILPPIKLSLVERSNSLDLDDMSALSNTSESGSAKSSLPLVSPESTSANEDFASFTLSVGGELGTRKQERRHSLSLSDDGYFLDYPVALMSPFDDTDFGVSWV